MAQAPVQPTDDIGSPIRAEVENRLSGSIAGQGRMNGLFTRMNTRFSKMAHLLWQAKTVSQFQRAVPRIGNLLIAGAVKIGVYRLPDHRAARRIRYLQWIEKRIAG